MDRNVMHSKLYDDKQPSKDFDGGFNKKSGTSPADFKTAPSEHDDWTGTVSGDTKHTYKND